MNYPQLGAALKTYMLREDDPYVAQIPTLIAQGINRVYYNAKDLGFEQKLTIELANGRPYLNKPAGWRETISITLVHPNLGYIQLLPRSREYCQAYMGGPNYIGPPKYYSDGRALEGGGGLLSYGEWLITPAADALYDMIIIFLGIPEFNDDHPTNFLTEKYPGLLLYSCLLEASLFLDNEEKRNKYEAMFAKELETINKTNVDRFTDRTIVRDKS